MTTLQHQLEEAIAREPSVQVSLAAKRLATGEEILIGPDAAFHPASTVKICVMMEVFHQREAGSLTLDEQIRVVNAFPSLANGSIYSLDPLDDSEKALYDLVGSSCPIGDLVMRMITASSNLATNLLLTRVSPRQTTEFMAQLGVPELRVSRGMEDKPAYRLGLNNAGTASSFMKLLVKLARGEVVSPAASDEMIEILARQQFNEMIPARLPAGTRVAHKTGWIDQHFHDVGIVYPTRGEAFVLAIMTRGFPEAGAERAHAFVASVARLVYDGWC